MSPIPHAAASFASGVRFRLVGQPTFENDGGLVPPGPDRQVQAAESLEEQGDLPGWTPDSDLVRMLQQLPLPSGA